MTAIQMKEVGVTSRTPFEEGIFNSLLCSSLLCTNDKEEERGGEDGGRGEREIKGSVRGRKEG